MLSAGMVGDLDTDMAGRLSMLRVEGCWGVGGSCLPAVLLSGICLLGVGKAALLCSGDGVLDCSCRLAMPCGSLLNNPGGVS